MVRKNHLKRLMQAHQCKLQSNNLKIGGKNIICKETYLESPFSSINSEIILGQPDPKMKEKVGKFSKTNG